MLNSQADALYVVTDALTGVTRIKGARLVQYLLVLLGRIAVVSI
jgi:hypothetical protein